MSADLSMPVLIDLRALLVIAALICLCVSSNVGLQFFPLAVATDRVTLNASREQSNQASHAPQADAQSFRVPMMMQSQKRADKEPPQSDPLAALSLDRSDIPRQIRFASEAGYPICFTTSVKMAPPAGRAPPPLV